jgi:hypothetical protein
MAARALDRHKRGKKKASLLLPDNDDKNSNKNKTASTTNDV